MKKKSILSKVKPSIVKPLGNNIYFKIIVMLICLLIGSAAEAQWGATFGVGRNTNMNVYRVSLQKTSPLFLSLPCNHSITSYWELSLNQVRGMRKKCCGLNKNCNSNNSSCIDKISNGALGHYFRFTQNNDYIWADPYMEGGVGISAFDKNHICERRLGSKALFEIKAGAGIRFGCYSEYDISYKYLHYSNAGMGEFNDAINLHLIVFNYWF